MIGNAASERFGNQNVFQDRKDPLPALSAVCDAQTLYLLAMRSQFAAPEIMSKFGLEPVFLLKIARRRAMMSNHGG